MRDLYLSIMMLMILMGSFFGVKYYVYHLDLNQTVFEDKNLNLLQPEMNNRKEKLVSLIPFPANQHTKRAKLFSPIIGQAFGNTITRVTDIETQGSKFLVARVQFWNSDASLIRLGHHKIFDAKTYAYLGKIPGRMYEVKWSHTNPNILYGLYHGFKKNAPKSAINPKNDFLFFSIDVRDGFKRKLIATFSKKVYSDIKIGPWEGNIDLNDRYVVFSAKKVGTDYLTAILYDIQAQKEIAHQAFPELLWSSSRKKNQHDWISISPLGNYILHAKSPRNPSSFADFYIEQYDLKFKPIRKLSNVSEHGDLCLNEAGEEVYVQFRNSQNKHGIYAFNLNNDQVTPLLGRKSYGGGHISCQNYKRKGWCYVSTKGKNYREIFALKLDGSREVERFAQTHGIEESRESSKGTPSPDGSQVLFQSTWGVLNRTEAYVVTRAKR